SAETNPAGNAVDRSREDFADTNRGYGINRAAGLGRVLDRQDQLPGRAQGIATVRHKNSAGVSTRPLDDHAEARGSGNVRDHSEWNLLAFQQRPLLDVQLDECLVIAAG